MIPDDLDLDRLEFRTGISNKLFLTDGNRFSLDLSEFADHV